ncbi:MAG: hypothetical protein K1W31_10105, partial [Lachnospiraceae bacterium]
LGDVYNRQVYLQSGAALIDGAGEYDRGGTAAVFGQRAVRFAVSRMKQSHDRAEMGKICPNTD